MAVSTVYSDILTNKRAEPSTINGSAFHGGGVVRSQVAEIELATTSLDEDGDIIMLMDLPSNARIKKIILHNDDLDSNGAPALVANLGLYAAQRFTSGGTTYTENTLIDEDAYATLITTLQSAATNTDLTYEVRDIAKANQRVYEDAGFTDDPQVKFRLALTISTAAATAAAGTVVCDVEYVLD